MQTQLSTRRNGGATHAIRVVLGVASPALLRGLEVLVGAMPGLDFAGSARTMKALLTLLSGMQSDVVIIDFPIDRDLLEAFLTRIRTVAPGTRVVLITEASRPVSMQEALKMGASRLMSKIADSEEILATVHSAASDRSCIAPECASRLAMPVCPEESTQRQIRVPSDLPRGDCNKAIPRDLDVSIWTGRTHARIVMAKQFVGLEQ